MLPAGYVPETWAAFGEETAKTLANEQTTSGYWGRPRATTVAARTKTVETMNTALS